MKKTPLIVKYRVKLSNSMTDYIFSKDTSIINITDEELIFQCDENINLLLVSKCKNLIEKKNKRTEYNTEFIKIININ